MDGTHPKRKKDKYNPYILVKENHNHYIQFKDHTGTLQTVPLTPELYHLFDAFELEDISHMNVVTRYLEQSELTEETINTRSFLIPPTVEETVFLTRKQNALCRLAFLHNHIHLRRRFRH